MEVGAAWAGVPSDHRAGPNPQFALAGGAGLLAVLTVVCGKQDSPQTRTSIVDLVDHLQHQERGRVKRPCQRGNEIDRQAVRRHDSDSGVNEQADPPDHA